MERRAVVLAASQRSWEFEAVATALRTTYPVGLVDSRVNYVQDQEDAWAVEEEATPGGASSSSPEGVQALLAEIEQDLEEPLEEEAAVQVLATWKDTRQEMNKERLRRGFRPAPPPPGPDLK
eukprot:6949496-Lingulodinium_polyedra.AAC.1